MNNNMMGALMSFLIADSRAKYYNVENPQRIKTTGLLMGMMMPNPLLSYLIIEQQAKNADKVVILKEKDDLINDMVIKQPYQLPLIKEICDLVGIQFDNVNKDLQNTIKNHPKIFDISGQVYDTFKNYVNGIITRIENRSKNITWDTVRGKKYKKIKNLVDNGLVKLLLGDSVKVSFVEGMKIISALINIEKTLTEIEAKQSSKLPQSE